jgi:hypothetical protein
MTMTKTIFGSISAIAFAAVIAGTMTLLPTFSNPVVASAPIQSDHMAVTTPVRDIKADRLDLRPLGSQCAEQAWPNFEANCVRNERAAPSEIKTVRIIPIDRR